MGADGLCSFHSPAYAGRRAEGHKRGGQRHRIPHKGDLTVLPERVRTLEGVLSILNYTLMELLAHENSIVRARALIALSSAFIAAISAGELEARLDAVESALKERQAWALVKQA